MTPQTHQPGARVYSSTGGRSHIIGHSSELQPHTDVGPSRAQRLRMLGNGVVTRQATAAYTQLLAAVQREVAA